MDGSGPTFPELLTDVVAGRHLSAGQARWLMGGIVDGEVTSAQIAAIAVALELKGVDEEEVLAFAEVLLERTQRVSSPSGSVDVVGTGGDRAHTVNVSTMAALVVAGTGRTVVKHGNRAASSRCGTADVLEELGVIIDVDAPQVAEVVRRAGIGFCFAGRFHTSLGNAAQARRELGIPTFFNYLGPLANPAQTDVIAAGVAFPAMGPVLCRAFAKRGTRALVFRGDDGLDEITVSAASTIWQLRDGEVASVRLEPEDVGLSRAPADALTGGDVAHNAGVVRAVLAGHERGPVRDAVLLNAAAAIVAEEPGRPDLVAALSAAIPEAARAIDSGAAEQVLLRWVDASREVGRAR